MATTPRSWQDYATQTIRRLAERPVTLFLFLLAINALARPYSNCVHDARLYSLQVLNRAEQGVFGHDVFLAYGSQDQFSLFSRLVAPAVVEVGVKPVFFVLYLIFNTLFVWAAFRLVRRLFPDPIVSTVSLLYLLTAFLYYGGHGIFAVHEQFATPRLVAVSLVLFAMERLLAQRSFASLGLLTIAFIIHPLMACGGLLIWGSFLTHAALPRKVFYALLAGAAFAGVALLAMPAVSFHLFGYMDEDWHEMIQMTTGYNYPLRWSWVDNLNLALGVALGFAGAAWLFRDDPVRARFFLMATLAAIIGVIVTTAASLTPYAILFQGQPYRAVWILKTLQIPLGFMVLTRLWASPAWLAKLATFALTAFFCTVNYAENELLLFVFAAIAALAFSWWLDDAPFPHRLWRAGISACVITACAWSFYRWGFIVWQRETLLDFYDEAEFLRLFLDCTAPVVWTMLGLGVAALAFENLSNPRILPCASIACASAMPLLAFGQDICSHWQARHTRFGGDIAQVRRIIDRRRTPGRAPTVYCSLGRAEYVWIELHAASYFDAVQTAGVMFNRKTALELRRRVQVVNKFEMERLRKEAIFMSEETKVIVEKMFHTSFDGPAPTVDDLARLAAEPGLDYIVIPQEFPGLYSAKVGRLFVYECYKVRSQPGPQRKQGLTLACAAG